MTPDQQFWWSWSVSAAAALATFLAVLAALFQGRLQAGIYPPILKFELVRKEGEKTKIKGSIRDALGNITPYEEDVRYHHLRVSNERRRWSPATDLRVFLTRLEEPGPDGGYQVVWVGNVPIRWRDQEVVPLTHTLGAAVDCDLCRVEKHNGLYLMPLIVPNNLEAHIPGACRLVLSLQARSRETDSEEVHVEISWDGAWEDGDTEMERHLKVRVL